MRERFAPLSRDDDDVNDDVDEENIIGCMMRFQNVVSRRKKEWEVKRTHRKKGKKRKREKTLNIRRLKSLDF